MHPKVGIGIIVLEKGKILLGKRKNAPDEGTWADPGGHLEYGETVKECARRELEEETGLIAEKVILGPWCETFDPHYIGIQAFVPKFSGTLENREPEKNESWKWFDIHHLPNPLFSGLKALGIENTIEPFLQKHFLAKPRLSYLSAPFHHSDSEVRKERFERITTFAGELIKQGMYVFSPITHNTPIKEMGIITEWEGGWKPYDLTMLSLCDQMILYQLPGWEDSRGVQEELAFAQEKNILIIEMKPETLV